MHININDIREILIETANQLSHLAETLVEDGNERLTTREKNIMKMAIHTRIKSITDEALMLFLVSDSDDCTRSLEQAIELMQQIQEM